MGNQQSISSNNNNGEINQPFNSNKFQFISNNNFNDKNLIDLNCLATKGVSSSIMANNTEISSDIMMRETNESLKSREEHFNCDRSDCRNYIEQNRIGISHQYPYPTVLITIEWNEGGENVFISGNFVNWSQWFLMNKKTNNTYEISFVIFWFFFLS